MASGYLGLTYLLAVLGGAAVSFSNSSFSEKITTLSAGKRKDWRWEKGAGVGPRL